MISNACVFLFRKHDQQYEVYPLLSVIGWNKSWITADKENLLTDVRGFSDSCEVLGDIVLVGHKQACIDFKNSLAKDYKADIKVQEDDAMVTRKELDEVVANLRAEMDEIKSAMAQEVSVHFEKKS